MSATKETIQAKLAASKKDKTVPPTPPTPRTTTVIAGQEVSVPTTADEKSYHVFYHTLRSCRMITKLGRVIDFVDGRYVTDQAPEIEYLQEELANGNYQLSVKPGQEVMTTSELNPMLVLRNKFREEYKQELIDAGKLNPQSTSEVQLLTPGSTSDTAALAADSTLP